jgi:hypothetical protein
VRLNGKAAAVTEGDGGSGLATAADGPTFAHDIRTTDEPVVSLKP